MIVWPPVRAGKNVKFIKWPIVCHKTPAHAATRAFRSCNLFLNICSDDLQSEFAEKESTSFLKKRSKKLLSVWHRRLRTGSTQTVKSFLLLFFKKEVLSSSRLSRATGWPRLPAYFAVGALVFSWRRGYETPLMPQLSFHTPLGALTLSEDEGAIVALDWGFGRDQHETVLLRRAREQLQAYFDRELTRFDLPLAPAGTPYRRRIWAALGDIPYGETRSYLAIARSAGGSARSVGGANAANPIPIIIPCHRVVGSGDLGGYSGVDGVQTKLFLLNHEQAPIGRWRGQMSRLPFCQEIA